MEYDVRSFLYKYKCSISRDAADAVEKVVETFGISPVSIRLQATGIHISYEFQNLCFVFCVDDATGLVSLYEHAIGFESNKRTYFTSGLLFEVLGALNGRLPFKPTDTKAEQNVSTDTRSSVFSGGLIKDTHVEPAIPIKPIETRSQSPTASMMQISITYTKEVPVSGNHPAELMKAAADICNRQAITLADGFVLTGTAVAIK